MSVAGYATLFSGPNQTGSVILFGLGTGDRYNHLTSSQLSAQGLLNSVSSGVIDTTNSDVNLIVFSNPDYSGQFAQFSTEAGDDSSYWHAGPAQSALLIASNVRGTTEHRLSFAETIRSTWDSTIDSELQGQSASRNGEPLLTWEMFPVGDQYVDSNQTYLKIYQPLTVHMPWPLSDHQAWVEYFIILQVVDGQIQGTVATAEWGCDSGWKVDQVMAKLKSAAINGMGTLQSKINNELELTRALGSFTDVFLLPDKQLTKVENSAFFGDTADDVTIVAVQ